MTSPVGRALELARDLFVGPCGSRREVPGAPVGIAHEVGRLRQRQVRGATVLRRAGAVDGRAHQRVTERHAPADREQPVRLRVRRSGGSRFRAAPPRATAAAGRRSAPRPRAGAAVRVSSGSACRRWPKLCSICPGRRPRRAARSRPPAASRSARAAARAARAGCRASRRRCGRGRARRAGTGPRSQAERGRRRRAGRGSRGPTDLLQIRARVARGEDERHGLGEQPSRDERQRPGGRPVEPLRVVDQAQQRPLLGCLGDETQHGQPDEEEVGRGTRAQAEDRSRAPRAAARALRRADRASARRSGAGSRTRAPSPTRRPRRAGPGSRTPPSVRYSSSARLADARPRRAAPACGSRRRGQPPARRPRGRTRCCAPAMTTPLPGTGEGCPQPLES